MNSKKRPLDHSDNSQDASPIASPTKRIPTFITTPKSSGKKQHKKCKLIQKLKNEKVHKSIFDTPPCHVTLNETTLPEDENEIEHEIPSGDSFLFQTQINKNDDEGLAIGLPLKTSTPHSKSLTDETITSGRKNDTDITNLLSKLSISKTQKAQYPEVINSAQLHMTDKHNYFQKDTPQYIGYSPKINKDNQKDMTTSQKDTIHKITRETNTLATTSQSVLKKIENLKSNEILTNSLSCVEIDHLTQLNRFTFWNSVLLHDMFLKLPKITDPNFDTYCHSFLNYSTFLRTKLKISLTDLHRILNQVSLRTTETQASIKFSNGQAKKASNMLMNKVKVANRSIETAINAIYAFKIGCIDSLSKSWLKLISSQLELMRKEMTRNIYFGGKEPALGDLSLETFLLEHRQPSVVVNSALYWLNSTILINSMLLAESQFVLNAAKARMGLES